MGFRWGPRIILGISIPIHALTGRVWLWGLFSGSSLATMWRYGWVVSMLLWGIRISIIPRMSSCLDGISALTAISGSWLCKATLTFSSLSPEVNTTGSRLILLLGRGSSIMILMLITR